MGTFELLVIVAMIALNGVFAGYEMALASIGLGRLQTLAREGRPGAKAALRMKQRMEASLAVVQLGITLVGATAAATSGAGAEESIEPLLRRTGFSAGAAEFLSLALVVASLTAATIIVGELIPKVFSLRNKEWVCLTLSRPMSWFSLSVWPAVWLLAWIVTRITTWGKDKGARRGSGGDRESAVQEIHEAAALARMSRLIGHREEGIIVSASRLAETPLRRIMLPAQYIGMLVANQSLSEALIAAHQEMHTRFPVTEEAGNPERIIGYVNFKDIVAALRVSPSAPSLAKLVRRLPTFDAEMATADCLEHLIREHIHIALVRDVSQGIVGLVTLEDIIEELVGEIYDEFDRMPAYLTPVGEGWIAGGFVSLKRLCDETGIELHPLSEKPLYSLNDWVVERLGRPPRGGDTITADSVRVMVRKTRQTLVQEAYLSGPVGRDTSVAEAEPGPAEESRGNPAPR
jgi:putative hemolysin